MFEVPVSFQGLMTLFGVYRGATKVKVPKRACSFFFLLEHRMAPIRRFGARLQSDLALGAYNVLCPTRPGGRFASPARSRGVRPEPWSPMPLLGPLVRDLTMNIWRLSPPSDYRLSFIFGTTGYLAVLPKIKGSRSPIYGRFTLSQRVKVTRRRHGVTRR